MKALFYTAPLEMTYQEAAPQDVVVGEVRVRVEAAGICGSDMHAYHGHDARRTPGLILGHEVCGTIVEGERSGERVVLNPLMTCGSCEDCQRGRTNLCENRTMIGMTRPGGMADEVVLPAANAIRVSAGIGSSHASLTEPAACVWHALELIKRVAFVPIQESRILVIGGGTIGLLAAKLFQHYGADEVVMVERNRMRQKTAERYGFGQVLGSIEGSAAFVSSFDIVFDAVGAAVTRKISIEAVRAGGVVLHIGLQSNEGEIDTRKITLQEVAFLGVYTYTEADFGAALMALEKGVFGDLFWVEERALADGNGAFADLDHGRVAAAKIVLVP
ncbi:MAG: threonine dehydrogenase-like Zn-dependent dehydrogenase [Cellvibrionaceae bacterium]|jgi:threonine dehydrogenase-like Zn-dependent dehydrogenase